MTICQMCLCLATGPDYVKQQLKEPVEIKEVPVEKKETSPKDSPHFYRKGTTPPHSPATSPLSTPPPSPHSSKKKGHVANNTSRKTSKEEKPARKTSKEEKSSQKTIGDERPAGKLSKEERPSVTEAPKGSQEAPPKPAKVQQPTPAPAPPPHPPAVPVNGQVHTEYHSYYVKAPSRVPPPPDPEEDIEEEPSALDLARMPPPQPKSFSAPTPKPASVRESKSDLKLRKQDSLKPKSLADTKKASMEIVDSTDEAVSVCHSSHLAMSTLTHHFCRLTYAVSCVLQGPNSILVAMVMLLNIGLAIIFVHFLT